MANPVHLVLLTGLVGTLAWGGVELTRDNTQLPEASPVPAEAPHQATPIPQLQPPPIEDFAVVVERPLFFVDRKLPVKTTPGDSPGANKKRPGSRGGAKAPELKVTGVFLQGDQSSVLVEMIASGNNRTLLIGETIAGWKLVKIDEQAITLQSGRKRQQYKLHQFDDSGAPKAQRKAPNARLRGPTGSPPRRPILPTR